MSTVIASVAIASIVGVLGYTVAPIRRWAVAEIRGYVALLALVNLLLANAIVWMMILLWP
jgi:hypothetical protein